MHKNDAHITLENVIQVKTILWRYAEEKSIKLRCVDCAVCINYICKSATYFVITEQIGR